MCPYERIELYIRIVFITRLFKLFRYKVVCGFLRKLDMLFSNLVQTILVGLNFYHVCRNKLTTLKSLLETYDVIFNHLTSSLFFSLVTS